MVRIAKGLAGFLIGAVILIVSFYFVISLCITYFKLTGQVVEGTPMYFDLYTPKWGPLLAAQGWKTGSSYRRRRGSEIEAKVPTPALHEGSATGLPMSNT